VIRPSWLLLLMFLSVPNAYGATRDSERPDREMLRMMEFLREMEMMKQMEILRDLNQVEIVGDTIRETPAQKSPAAKKREGVR